MIPPFRPILTALLLLTPLPLWAQFAGVAFDGRVAIGGTDLVGGTGTGVLDFTLTLPLQRDAPLAFELGTYLFAVESKNPHETYAAFAWQDRFRIGVVRPAYDAVLPSVFERAAPYLAYRHAERTRSAATVQAMRRTAVPWGVSARISHAGAEWQASLHEADKGGFSSASLSVLYAGTGWQMAAAVERLAPYGGQPGYNAKIGGRADLGRAQLGLTLLRPDANDHPDTLALDLVLPVADRLTLLAMAELTEGKEHAYGLGLDYAVTRRDHVLVSATDSPKGRGMHLSLEHQF